MAKLNQLGANLAPTLGQFGANFAQLGLILALLGATVDSLEKCNFAEARM